MQLAKDFRELIQEGFSLVFLVVEIMFEEVLETPFFVGGFPFVVDEIVADDFDIPLTDIN